MASELLKDFRLIFLDLPGHGDSARLKEYKLSIMSEMLTEFIQLKKLENYAVVGHSIGGHVAIHTLPFIEPKGLFIFGTPPLKRPFDLTSFIPNSNGVAMMKQTPSMEEIEAIMIELNYSGIDKEIAIEDYLKTDGHFRDTIFSTIPKNEYSDEVDLLKKYKDKCRVLISKQETIVNNQYIEKNLLKKIKGLEFSYIESKHSPQNDCTESFNLILADFAHSVFGTK